MKTLPNMALFVEVVNARGFRRAAEITGVPNATLSRRVSELEKSLGVRLLHRTTRKIELTEVGQIYFEHCKRIVAEALLANEQLNEITRHPKGVLRVSLPMDPATIYLTPLIVAFSNIYPDISFQFELNPRRADLITDAVDVAIRIGHLPDSQLIARQIASVSSGLYASTAYLEQAGEPTHPAELSAHQCIVMNTKSSLRHWALLHQQQGESYNAVVNGRFSVNGLSMIYHLASLNCGIAILPKIMISKEASSPLKHILPQWAPALLPIYAVTATRLLPVKTQYFIEFLSQHLEQHLSTASHPIYTPASTNFKPQP